jgi:hypothetical protein
VGKSRPCRDPPPVSENVELQLAHPLCDSGIWVAKCLITILLLTLCVSLVPRPLDDKRVFSVVHLSRKVVKVSVCESER